MARALATQPPVLVLIAPTAGVDVRSKQTLLDVVEQVRTEGSGVLIVSDELDDLRICDRVIVMFHGRAVIEMAQGWQRQRSRRCDGRNRPHDDAGHDRRVRARRAAARPAARRRGAL